MMRAAFAGALLVAMTPLTGSAQTSTAEQPPPANQGPMIVERVHSGFVLAPEVKATLFDKRVKPLVGGTAGWVYEETFFVGGGGYWMPEAGRSERELAYGGAVLQWFLLNGDRFGLSAKGLLGGGRATLPDTITQIVIPVPAPPTGPTPPTGRNTPPVPPQPRTVTTAIRAREDFLLAEPELNARFALTRHVRVTAGAGYRFAGTDWHRYHGFDRGVSKRLSGATASFGVQIGG